MQLKKLYMAMTAVSAMTLAACGGGSSSSSSNDNNSNESNAVVAGTPCTVGTGVESLNNDGTNEKIVVDAEQTDGLPVCVLSGVISGDVRLTTDYVYRLAGYVTVGDGNVELDAYDDASEVTLTVDAGVQFRSTGKGSLVISRGSKIMANGTAAAPIVMASEDLDASEDENGNLVLGFEDQGEWGGLVLQGFAQNNQCVAEYAADEICNTDDEAGTGFHGGENDADSSGTIRYLIVAEGGFEVAPDSEVNGITLHSVGYGTTLEHIAILNNADDGIEFFGGAANVKNLILVDNGDESIDWDDGYRGNIQFGYVLQNAEHDSDHGIEADSLGKEGSVVANPSVANVTFKSVNPAKDELLNLKKDTLGLLDKIEATGYGADECAKLDGDATEVTITTSDLSKCDGVTFEKNDENVVVTAAELTVNGKTINKDTADKTVPAASPAVSATTTQNADNNNNSFMVQTDYIGAGDAATWAAWVKPYSAPLSEDLTAE
jgi:hypothetical protein